jgi:hypothetical protein
MLREGYTSENAPQLSVSQVESLLMELPEIRRDLEERFARDAQMYGRRAA